MHALGRIPRLARALSLAFMAFLALSPRPVLADATLPNLTSLLRSIPDSSWVRVNLNAWSEVWTPVDLQPPYYAGDTKPGSILAAWSSFAWDSNRGDLILWGGGHANYAGNEIYRWRGSTQRWERGSVPSDVKNIGGLSFEAIDGAQNAPTSSHTYDNQLFLPRLDRFITFGGAAFDTGGSMERRLADGTVRRTGPFLWDPAKADPNKVGGTTGSHVQATNPHPEITGGNMWQNIDLWDGHVPLSSLPSSFVNGVSDYTLENGVDTVYIGGRYGGGVDQNLYRLRIPSLTDRTQDVWEWVGLGWWGVSNKGAGIYDPVRRAFIRTGSTNWLSYWDVTTPGVSNKDVVVTLPSAGESFSEDYGMDRDPGTGDLVYWGGGGAVWNVRPPTPIGPDGWTVTRQPDPVGPVPSANLGTGVLGKWKYIRNLDAFMALEVTGDVWLYRPVGWSDPGQNQPPTVAVTAPAGGATYTAPATITITAAASDADGAVTSVQFYAGATLLGTATSAPYTVTWSDVPIGSYSLYAVATDNGGATDTSSLVTVTVNPGSGPNNVAAAAAGGVATASSYYPGYVPGAAIDGDRKGLNWSANGGWNDATGDSWPDWLQVTFAGTKTINEIDVFTLQDNYAAPVTPTLAMTFANYGISDFRVQYWTSGAWADVPGGVVTGNRNVWRQFQFAPVTTDRIRVLVNLGLGTYSRVTEVEAWTAPAGGNAPPSVTLTAPASGATATAPASFSLSASASDSDGTIARVDFYAGGGLIGSDTSAPYGMTWSDVPSGTYTLTAVATDNLGATTTSAGVTVTVNASTSGVNVAAAAAGGVASASSFYPGYSPSAAIDGDRKGVNWSANGGWNDATGNAWPDWLQINFAGTITIGEIDVFTLQDNYGAPVAPTPAMLFASYGITDFQVQYWNGSGWTDVPGGAVSGNRNVWRQFRFAPVTTDRIRVLVNGALNTFSRITEVEAWSATGGGGNVPPSVTLTAPGNGATAIAPASFTVSADAADSDGNVARVDFYASGALIGTDTSAPYGMTWGNVAPGTYSLTAVATDNLGAATTSAAVTVTVNASTSAVNVAAAANGGVASASSTYSTNYAPAGAINGDRNGTSWAAGGGWNDGTGGTYPDWLQVTFNGAKTINQVNVFTLQDTYWAPQAPTPTMTFTGYGITAFDVQAWNGSAWATVPGGSITGNNLVWRSITFPAVTTDRIRIVVNSALATYSRITEVEAYTP